MRRMKRGWHQDCILKWVSNLFDRTNADADELGGKKEHDTLAKKSSSKNVKAVEVFRGVSFDDWLRVFMQAYHVRCPRRHSLSNPCCSAVLFLAHPTWAI